MKFRGPKVLDDRNGSLNATNVAADETRLKVGQTVPYGNSYGRSS